MLLFSVFYHFLELFYLILKSVTVLICFVSTCIWHVFIIGINSAAYSLIIFMRVDPLPDYKKISLNFLNEAEFRNIFVTSQRSISVTFG